LLEVFLRQLSFYYTYINNYKKNKNKIKIALIINCKIKMLITHFKTELS